MLETYLTIMLVILQASAHISASCMRICIQEVCPSAAFLQKCLYSAYFLMACLVWESTLGPPHFSKLHFPHRRGPFWESPGIRVIVYWSLLWDLPLPFMEAAVFPFFCPVPTRDEESEGRLARAKGSALEEAVVFLREVGFSTQKPIYI